MPQTKLNNTEYFYNQFGEGDPIIFAHGLFVDNTIFKYQIEDLQNKFCCYSFDMPGHGQSSYYENGWTLDDIVEDFHDFIVENKLENVILIGQSQGGMVFMRFAIKYPELVSKLILIGTSDKAEFKERIGFWQNKAESFKNGSIQEYRESIKTIQKNVVSEFFLQNNPKESQEELEIMQSQNPLAMALGIESAILKRDDICGNLSKIKCETLIMCGEEDHATPLDISLEMKSKITNSEISIISKAAHHIPIENPKEVNSSIHNFLNA